MRRWLREATSDSDERRAATLGMWKSVADEISKYPLEARRNIEIFVSQMISRGDSYELSSWKFNDYFGRVLTLLAENPDLRPDVHTRAKKIDDESDIGYMSIAKLKDHISAALILLERGRARADAMLRGEPYSPEEKSVADDLISLMSRIQDHAEFFEDMREEARTTSTGLALVDELKSIHARDPKFEREASRRRVVNAITLCFGKMPSWWRTFDLVNSWTSAFESWTMTLQILGSEEFTVFVQKLESSLSRLHKFQQENDFELDEATLERTMECIGVKFSGYNVESALLPVVKNGKFAEMTRSNRDDHTPQVIRLFKMISRDDESEDPIDSLIKHVDECVDRAIKKARALLDAVPEHRPGDPDPIFGKFVFAPDRKGAVPPEKNTPEENAAFLGIRDHIKANEPMPQDVALDLMGVLDDGAYSEIIHEPKSEYIFRGMALDEDSLRELIKLPPDEDVPTSGSAVVNRMIKAAKRGEGSSSWSADFKSAAEFSSASWSTPFSVILVAKRSENPSSFIEGPDGLYKIPGFSTFAREKESIALGSIRVHKVYWSKSTAGEIISYVVPEAQAKTKAESRQLDLLRKFVAEAVRRG